jgi:hypothetical protein
VALKRSPYKREIRGFKSHPEDKECNVKIEIKNPKKVGKNLEYFHTEMFWLDSSRLDPILYDGGIDWFLCFGFDKLYYSLKSPCVVIA